jgi:AAA domain-containing protein
VSGYDGDPGQGHRQAVQNGGGMSLLAAAVGYVRLAEPVRFRSGWEQQASLRLHDEDSTVLAGYDQHSRIVGGEPKQMMDAAAAAWVALAADLITCTRNDHSVEAGEPGRALANGDLLRIEAATASGLIVRRALDADPATGQRRWTDRTFVYSDHGDANVAYVFTTSPKRRTRCPARGQRPSWPATTRFIPNEMAFPPRSPILPRRVQRWACSPRS